MQTELPVRATAQPIVAIPAELSIQELKRRQDLIQEAIKAVMIEGHHFGVIPGTGDKKRVLHKPGAEKLCSLFRLAPTFSVRTVDLPESHRDYHVTCTLTHQDTGSVLGMAMGSCSTMESKYRWRLASRKCPQCGAEAIRKGKEEYGGGFFCSDKHGGCKTNFKEGDQRIIGQALGRVPNQDIADTWNTVLKMAQKRAHVAAVLLVTAASDALIAEEDQDDDEPETKPKKGTEKKPAPPVELTAKQRLLRDCLARHEALTKMGKSKDDIVQLLGQHGIVMPPLWKDLSEAELEQVKKAFDEALQAGTEVK